jgi:hypothetical protein
MKFKEGVQIRGMRPEIAAALAVLSTVKQDAVVTSVTDGTHSKGSLHYAGAAFDVRTRELNPDQVDVLAAELEVALTDEFDVVVEPTHIHVEFQPKEALNG